MLNMPADVTRCGAALGVVAVIVVTAKLAQRSKLDVIHTIGANNWFSSWWGGFGTRTDVFEVIQEGYEKYKRVPFKVVAFGQSVVILSSREHLEELSKAPDDILSNTESLNNVFQIEYTMGPGIHHNPYHVPVIRSRLTRNIGALYSEIRDEITNTFDDVLGLRGNEWKSVPALHSVQKIACRASNRVFVGLPLCRDPEWNDLNIQYTVSVVKGASIIRLFPTALKPLAARLFSKVVENKVYARKLLGPVIEERRGYLVEYGKEWTDKLNDFLSWLMDEAEGPEQTVEALTTRMLVINFVSIHTSSISFTHVLFYLAAEPQYIQPLREEVEAIVDAEGWSKAALEKMRKVDSFLRECQRVEGTNAVSMGRKALKDFTFSDGTFIPKGTTVTVGSRLVHHDGESYPNAHVWEPFRFAELRQEDGEGTRHRFVSTTIEYLPFGHGRHACPGRFFAATLLKSMLAHIVVTYDVKLEGNTPRPQALHIGMANMPNPSAKVMFRRRVS